MDADLPFDLVYTTSVWRAKARGGSEAAAAAAEAIATGNSVISRVAYAVPILIPITRTVTKTVTKTVAVDASIPQSEEAESGAAAAAFGAVVATGGGSYACDMCGRPMSIGPAQTENMQLLAAAVGQAMGNIRDLEQESIAEVEAALVSAAPLKIDPTDVAAVARYLSVTRRVQKKLARKMSKSKLRSMLAEIKRYNKPTKGVVTVITALFLLLDGGEGRPVEDVRKYLGKSLSNIPAETSELWKIERKKI